MHFGPKINIIIILLLIVSGCKQTESFTHTIKSPDQGQSVKLGDEVEIER